MKPILAALLIGRIEPLPPDGRPSAIARQAVDGPLWLGVEGLAGDQHADLHNHGGADRALLQVPEENYALIAALLPASAARCCPGFLGENLSSRDMSAAELCIGDRYALGGAVIEASLPRQPCWKLNHRLEDDHAAERLGERGLQGWYWRVVRPGEVAAGHSFELLSRGAGAVSVARVWELHLAHRPEPDELEAVAGLPALERNWAERFRRRAAWLRNNVQGNTE